MGTWRELKASRIKKEALIVADGFSASLYVYGTRWLMSGPYCPGARYVRSWSV